MASPNDGLVSLLFWMDAALSAVLLQHPAGVSPMLEPLRGAKRSPNSQVHCATLCPVFPSTGSSGSTAVPFLSLGYPAICFNKIHLLL